MFFCVIDWSMVFYCHKIKDYVLVMTSPCFAASAVKTNCNVFTLYINYFLNCQYILKKSKWMIYKINIYFILSHAVKWDHILLEFWLSLKLIQEPWWWKMWVTSLVVFFVFWVISHWMFFIIYFHFSSMCTSFIILKCMHHS